MHADDRRKDQLPQSNHSRTQFHRKLEAIFLVARVFFQGAVCPVALSAKGKTTSLPNIAISRVAKYIYGYCSMFTGPHIYLYEIGIEAEIPLQSTVYR